MQKLGIAFEVKKLNKQEFEKALIVKIEEEAGGIIEAETREKFIEELTDLLSVIDEVKKVKRIKPVELQSVQRMNMKKKGGFSRRLWLVWSEDDGYKTNEKRGKK